ncbi:CapA family protein [Tannerella forsythia]|uniref:CapA family protein n=1 Tax=Tannerella forsythia TaxID=28112 RepID=A0A3P1XX85_TANFO|nr:CapA family protein [Tannerella forsythia]RRD62630.1 CapA family protein [Tannerella forsythia]
MHSLSRSILIPALTLAAAVTGYVTWNVLNQEKNHASPDDVVQHVDEPQRARLVFAGDLMQHMPQVRAARRQDGTFDYSETFRYVKPIFEEADFAMLNFETTLTPTSRYTGYPMFRSPAQLADAIRDIGIDAVVMANNHICDNGRTGIEYMTARFDSLGIVHTGAFIDSTRYRMNHPLRFEVKGIRFALLNYTYDTNGVPIPKGTIVNLIDTTVIQNDLKRIDRSETDCIIVFFHWGDEYVRKPNDTQRKLAELCHRYGTEIVMGSHPHVIQPFETRYDTDSIVRSVTVYSLGNFVSNQLDRYKNGGLIVTLDVEKKNEQIEICPYYTPVWVSMPNYRILPPSVADTLPLPSGQRESYRQFIRDTRTLLNDDRIFKER